MPYIVAGNEIGAQCRGRVEGIEERWEQGAKTGSRVDALSPRTRALGAYDHLGGHLRSRQSVIKSRATFVQDQKFLLKFQALPLQQQRKSRTYRWMPETDSNSVPQSTGQLYRPHSAGQRHRIQAPPRDQSVCSNSRAPGFQVAAHPVLPRDLGAAVSLPHRSRCRCRPP